MTAFVANVKNASNWSVNNSGAGFPLTNGSLFPGQ